MALSGDERTEVDTLVKQRIKESPTPSGATKASLNLENVDNNSDANKPVSTAQAAEDQVIAQAVAAAQAKADAAVPTATYTTNRTADNSASVIDSRLSANVWLRDGVLTGYVSGAGTLSATDTILSAIQKLNGNDALKSPIASPTFTGTPSAPTASSSTNTTQLATTAFVQSVVGGASSGTTLTATATAGVGMGTSPTGIGVASATTRGGILSFTTGTTPVNGVIVTVSFGMTYSSAPKIMLERYSDAAVLGTTLYRVGTITTTGFTLVNVSSSTLTASSLYTIAYQAFI